MLNIINFKLCLINFVYFFWDTRFIIQILSLFIQVYMLLYHLHFPSGKWHLNMGEGRWREIDLKSVSLIGLKLKSISLPITTLMPFPFGLGKSQ